MNFLSEDFLLQTAAARRLYHEHAAKMPIYDYHCHLPVNEIADDVKFENLTQIWLYGDHYKWRAMRANGIAEQYITGRADDFEKFEKWAQTVPYTLRNPLYDWTHLELKRYFQISSKLLNKDNAKEIYNSCGEKLRSDQYSVKNLLRAMNVKVICTTDEPLDSLEAHRKIKKSGFEIKVLPTFRPDKATAAENVNVLNGWIDKLQQASNIDIVDFESYIEAIKKRHDYFHENGCRLSDYSLETQYAQDYKQSDIEKIFNKIRKGKELDLSERAKFKSAMMIELASMDSDAGWVMQLHLGALRNNNTRCFKKIGPDSGFDSLGDMPIAKDLSKFLDRLDANGKLPKTIAYNLNPKDNYTVAVMLGNFQDASIPAKMQYGPAWWFLDQKHGIENHLDVLSDMGLLSRFIGMTTDSRSFLSYPRHEYFRRILCNLLGSDIENGLLPKESKLIGQMVENICFNNAENYFAFKGS